MRFPELIGRANLQGCYPKLVSVLLVIHAFVACSRTAGVSSSHSQNENSASLRTDLEFNKSLGAVQFQIDPAAGEFFSAKSTVHSDIKVDAIGENKFILRNLKPGTHTILIEARKERNSSYAGMSGVTIEAGTIFDLGLVALQRPAEISARLLAIKDSKVIPGAVLRIAELGLETVSDANGRIEFKNIPEGQWKIDVYSESGAGLANRVGVTARSGKSDDLGDIWLGEWPLGVQRPILVNAPQGFLSELELELQARFPSEARTFKILDEVGNELLARQPVRKNIRVKMRKSGQSKLRLVVYDERRHVVGEMSFDVVFDPFSDGKGTFVPRVSIDRRSIVSPNRTFSLTLVDPPSKAAQVRIGFKSQPGSAAWHSIQSNYQVTLEKKNSACGRQEIAIRYRTEEGLESQELTVPVTLSCWERIPQRALLEKLVGIENAATWTGEYAFVWSGKLTKAAAGIGVRGSYTQDTIEFLEDLQKEVYMDGGYVFNPATRDMEFIVTDSAPRPRAAAGVAGRLIDSSGSRRNLVAVYGGENGGAPIADGALYDIETNAWYSMNGDGAPSPRRNPSVHFISDEEVLVWGGLGRTNMGYDVALGDGAIYNVRTHSWRKMANHQGPSPRHAHVSVWSGGNNPEFVVLGGKRPGEVYLDSGARYFPRTDSWIPTPSLSEPAPGITTGYGPFAHAGSLHTRLSGQPEQKGKVIVFGGKSAQGIYLRKGFIFDLDTNSVSQQGIPMGDVNGVADLYLSPTVFLDGDGSSADGSRFWVVAGRASEVNTDIETRVLVYRYKDGLVATDNYRQFTKTELGPVLSKYNTGGKPIYTCCSDWLAFPANGKTYLMNGTATNDSSVYTSLTAGTTAGGRTVSGSNQLQQTKIHHSLETEYLPESGNFMFKQIDGVRTQKADVRPNGPINIYSLNEPVWDPIENSLIFYGGRSYDGFFAKDSLSGWFGDLSQDDLGGWMYDLETRQWTSLRKESNQTFQRANALSFILDRRFFQIGGVRTVESVVNGVTQRQSVLNFDGFVVDHRANPNSDPSVVLPTEADWQFDYTPIRSSVAGQSWAASTCVDQQQSKVMLVGGLRVSNRAISELDFSNGIPAITQRATLFDATKIPPGFRYPSSDPLMARHLATVVSIPSGCFIWGGLGAPQARYLDTVETIADLSTTLSSGTIYDFLNDSWNPVSSVNAPQGRISAHGVWTGEEVLVWGGLASPRLNMEASLHSPKGVWFYNPTSQRWRALPPTESEPRYRGDERPVWTGSNLIIWKSREQDFSWFFNPAENKWSQLAAPAGFAFNAVSYHENYSVWMGTRLFVVSSSDASAVTMMAIFIPPDP